MSCADVAASVLFLARPAPKAEDLLDRMESASSASNTSRDRRPPSLERRSWAKLER